MKKIILVDSCMVCPYWIPDSWYDDYCNVEMRDIADIFIIQEWCPLDDLEPTQRD